MDIARRTAGAANVTPAPIRLRGTANIGLIALIVAAILGAATWKPGIAFDIYGTHLELQNALRDIVLVLIALASLWLTKDEHRAANGFTYEPIREVAILFAGIFVAIIPVMAMLRAGRDGTFAFLLQAVTAHDGSPHEAAYFWLTAYCRASSTTRRLIWCSSNSPAATRRS